MVPFPLPSCTSAAPRACHQRGPRATAALAATAASPALPRTSLLCSRAPPPLCLPRAATGRRRLPAHRRRLPVHRPFAVPVAVRLGAARRRRASHRRARPGANYERPGSFVDPRDLTSCTPCVYYSNLKATRMIWKRREWLT